MSVTYKFKIGLAIGRTHPFHKGHKFLIDSMLKNCEKSYWFIGSPEVSGTDKCPYTLIERYSFISRLYSEEMLSGKLIVSSLPDLGNLEKWGRYVLDKVPEKVDAYFTGSQKDAYPFEKHDVFIANLYRKLNGYKSGTEIRALIRNNDSLWKEYVPEELHDMIDQFNI